MVSGLGFRAWGCWCHILFDHRATQRLASHWRTRQIPIKSPPRPPKSPYSYLFLVGNLGVWYIGMTFPEFLLRTSR